MTQAKYYPEASAALDSAIMSNPLLGARLDAALDLIEADPPDERSKRRAWVGGVFGIDVHCGDDDWLILWKATTPRPTVVFIGPAGSI